MGNFLSAPVGTIAGAALGALVAWMVSIGHTASMASSIQVARDGFSRGIWFGAIRATPRERERARDEAKKP